MKIWKVEIITKGKENLVGKEFLVYADTKDKALQIVIDNIYYGNKNLLISAEATDVTDEYINSIIEGD